MPLNQSHLVNLMYDVVHQFRNEMFIVSWYTQVELFKLFYDFLIVLLCEVA